MNQWQVFSTRQLDAAIGRQIMEAGFSLTQENFIAVTPVDDPALKKEIEALATSDAVMIFTSAHAVEAVKQYVDENAGWKIACLSGNTCDTVRNNFPSATIIATADHAGALARQLIDNKTMDTVFFCGDQRRDELPSLLKAAGLPLKEYIVYNTVETPYTIGSFPDAVLFFSPSAVRSFFRVNTVKDNAALFAIGQTTADEIKKFSGNPVIVAAKPSQPSVTSALIDYYTQQVQ